MRSSPSQGVIERWRDRLPFEPGDPVVSLGEGSTPLVLAERVSERAGCEVWLKLEGANPTGSFKDRGMTCAVSAAVREGAQAVICASTGNTAASAAAYAARAGLTGAVIVPEGKIATGKLAQALMHGARVIALRGNFDEALTLVRELAQRHPIALVNSVNPFRLQGQKTAAFEIVDALGDAPDVHCLPVGNAGNISAYWKGYREYAEAGRSGVKPMMWGFQASGAAPLVEGVPVPHPQTAASAIRIGNPASWQLAVAARDESGGHFESVIDADILRAQRDVARHDGVFIEPASATGVAGLLAAAARGSVPAGSRIVVTLTGHGLKDPETAIAGLGSIEPLVVDADADAVAAAANLSG
jgi:threonine synthase